MKNHFSKILISILLVVALLVCTLTFFACNKKQPTVDYRKTNDYSVKTEEYVFNPSADEEYQFGAVVYYPENVTAKYGFVFFVGSFIPSEYYEYLGTALAKQGYIVAIPNVMANSAYTYYDSNTKVATEKIFNMFKGVKFFVGGHSQGGGAALKFAEQEEEHLLGAVFLSPLCYTVDRLNPNYDPYNDPVSEMYERDEEGNIIQDRDTLENSTLPVLLLEAANDHVLTDAMKEDARSRMPANYTRFVLSPASHMSFSTLDSDSVLIAFNNDGDGMDEQEKIAQRSQTVNHILDFLQIIVCG